MTSTKLLEELYGLVSDVNTEEITTHIRGDNLSEWCRLWRIEAERRINEVEKHRDVITYCGTCSNRHKCIKSDL